MEDKLKSISWRLRKLAKDMGTHIPSGAEQMSDLTGEEMLEFFLEAKRLSAELDSAADTSAADKALLKVRELCAADMQQMPHPTIKYVREVNRYAKKEDIRVAIAEALQEK